ncbi:MAG: DUF177 domain-containing protein [SAR324 cluster bacterium]|nr:DUF177 domain-containing protein [SAR324 cluster bacterium]
MKFHLSQIPEEGISRKLEVPADSLPRLKETFGPQTGIVTAELLLKQRGGNVEVSGTLRAALDVPCHRCLEPARFELDEPLQVTLSPESRLSEMDDDTNLSAGDLEVSFFDGDQIDLNLLLEDEVLLLVPETICEEDEDGRCTECGKDLNEMFQPAEKDEAHHPFAQLKELLK